MLHYLFAVITKLLTALIYLFLGFLLALGFAFAIAHTIDSWNAPEHPYSGFSPYYHTAHLDTP